MDYKDLGKLYYSKREKYEEIYQNRFNGEQTAHFPFYISGNPAFLVYTGELFSLVSNIHKKDKEVRAIASKLPYTALTQYVRRNLVDEVKLTSEIEGVASTRKEIQEIIEELQEFNKEKKRLVGLVQKYLMLDDEDLELNNCSDIRAIYNELVSFEVHNENEKDEPDGTLFRKDTVYVRNKHGEIIHTGIEPEERIIEYMDKAIAVANDDSIDPLIRVALFHYLVGYIHPFYNGNGRIARYISSKMLSKELHFLVGYRLSYTIKEKITEYYNVYELTNSDKNKGDLTSFTIAFLRILLRAVTELADNLNKKAERWNYYQNAIQSSDIYDDVDKRILSLLLSNTLYGEVGIPIDAIAKIIECSHSTIRNHMSDMPKEMFFVSKGGRKKLYDLNYEYLDKIIGVVQ